MLLALCEGNSLVTGEFPAQRISNAEKASIWWRHHELTYIPDILLSLSGIITLFITKNVEIDDWEYLYHHVDSTDSGAAFIYYTFEDIIIQRHRVIKTNLRCKFSEPIEGGRRQDIIWTNIGILLINLRNKHKWNFKRNFLHFHSGKCIWKFLLENGYKFVSASVC